MAMPMDIPRNCPSIIFRGCDGGAAVNPYCNVTSAPNTGIIAYALLFVALLTPLLKLVMAEIVAKTPKVLKRDCIHDAAGG
eukprot:4507962-Ditylum_brightwellii.AAC.1